MMKSMFMSIVSVFWMLPVCNAAGYGNNHNLDGWASKVLPIFNVAGLNQFKGSYSDGTACVEHLKTRQETRPEMPEIYADSRRQEDDDGGMTGYTGSGRTDRDASSHRRDYGNDGVTGYTGGMSSEREAPSSDRIDRDDGETGYTGGRSGEGGTPPSRGRRHE